MKIAQRCPAKLTKKERGLIHRKKADCIKSCLSAGMQYHRASVCMRLIKSGEIK